MTTSPSIYGSYEIRECVIREDVTLAKWIISTGVIKGYHVTVEHLVTQLAMTSEVGRGIYCPAETSHLWLEYRSYYTAKLCLCCKAFRILT